MPRNFWKSKNVLVTGSTGFIGSWLTEFLVNRGSNVTALVKKNCPIGTDSIKHISGPLKIQYGNLLDYGSLTQAVESSDIVFHLGAVTQVIYSIKNPRETMEVNAIGTLNVLEAIRNSSDEKFLVHASTDKVYGEPKYNPIDENHTLSSKSPYDASKVAADRLVNSYDVSYGIKSSIVRWSNTYGGRDANALRIVPDFVLSLLENRPLVIRGNGSHVRDYMHVSDAVSGIAAVAENQKVSNGQVFNLGTEKPTSVIELAKLVSGIFGNRAAEIKTLGKDLPGEIIVQYLSCKKASDTIDWKPEVGLEQGLRETINWYKENAWWREVVKRVSAFYNLAR